MQVFWAFFSIILQLKKLISFYFIKLNKKKKTKLNNQNFYSILYKSVKRVVGGDGDLLLLYMYMLVIVNITFQVFHSQFVFIEIYIYTLKHTHAHILMIIIKLFIINKFN